MIKQEISRGCSFLKKKGFLSTVIKAKRHIREQAAYQMWPVLGEDKLERQRKHKFSYIPKISILVPLYRTPLDFLEEMIESVTAQTYPNWELCLADGTARETEITRKVQEYLRRDSRIKYEILDKNQGISGNTNAAMKLAEGDYIALFDHDDILAPSALYEVVRALNKNPSIDCLYTDEDKADTDGKSFYMPHFKPDYNEDYFQANNYICHFFVTRRQIALDTGGFDSRFDGAQDYDFIWKCIERSQIVFHIPKVLYHWRCHSDSTAGRPESKMYAYENGVKALKAHYERCGIDASVSMYEDAFGYYKTEYIKKEKAACTTLCVDLHKQDVKALNEAIQNQKHRYVLLMDRKGKWKDKDAEEILLSYVMRENTAIAGGRIYGKKGKLIFGGFILGVKGLFGYAFAGADKRDRGYYLRICVPQETMAVCGGCMMIDTEWFRKVGGLDETLDFVVSVVDYCLKVRTMTGKIAVYVPDAILYTENRRQKINIRTEQIRIFQKRWGCLLKKGDPFYNRNLTLNRTDYSLKKRGMKY